MATVKLDPAKGVQIPNMTTTERNAVSSPETGALVWNTTTSAVNQYNGSAWGTVGISEDTTKLPLAGGALTGAVTTNSTFDGVDIATRDAILTSTTTTAGAALPKAGGAMTGTITNFRSTGIDDNADALAMTITSAERVGINKTSPDGKLEVLAGSETGLVVKTSVSGEYGAIIQSVSTNRTPILEIRDNAGGSVFRTQGNGETVIGDSSWGTLPQNAEETLLITEDGTARVTIRAGENSSARDAILQLQTKHDGAQQRIRFLSGDHAAGTMHGEIFHNKDGQYMSYTSGADSTADGQHYFHSGIGRGLNLNGGQLSFADDVERTYAGVNTGALIAVGYYADNNGARYHHGLFWASYGIGTSTVIVVGDPANRFRGTDTDGNMCCMSAAGQGTFRIKNRLGVTTNVSINVIQMQGN